MLPSFIHNCSSIRCALIFPLKKPQNQWAPGWLFVNSWRGQFTSMIISYKGLESDQFVSQWPPGWLFVNSWMSQFESSRHPRYPSQFESSQVNEYSFLLTIPRRTRVEFSILFFWAFFWRSGHCPMTFGMSQNLCYKTSKWDASKSYVI
jgi:hypothetical protein